MICRHQTKTLPAGQNTTPCLEKVEGSFPPCAPCSDPTSLSLYVINFPAAKTLWSYFHLVSGQLSIKEAILGTSESLLTYDLKNLLPYHCTLRVQVTSSNQSPLYYSLRLLCCQAQNGQINPYCLFLRNFLCLKNFFE